MDLTDSSLIEGAQARVSDLHTLQAAGLIPRHGRFFPAGVHYPPITRYPPADDLLAGWSGPIDGLPSLYVHIPFCARRCTFCHYPVVTGSSPVEQGAFLDALELELDRWMERLGVSRLRARSVLFAGGTPTLLEPRLFQRLHRMFTARVDLEGCSQISYDVHPVDLLGPQGDERLAIMRGIGARRLTIGVQSMDDQILRRMNRGYTARTAREAVDRCHAVGFDDVGIEFIFGYPGQTPQSWLQTLRAGIALGAEEIQLYRLKIEAYGDSAGPILRAWERGRARVPPPEEAIVMKASAIALLQASGYHQNLTRVFTRRPEHTSEYATDQCCRLFDTIGFGPSAFSSLWDRFGINTPTLDDYYRRLGAGGLALNRGIVRDRDASLRWHFMLPLKNAWVSKGAFRLRTGEDAGQVFRPELDALLAHGLLEEDDQSVRLTPRGRFFADEICMQFHQPQYMAFPLGDYADGPLRMAREAL